MISVTDIPPEAITLLTREFWLPLSGCRKMKGHITLDEHFVFECDHPDLDHLGAMVDMSQKMAS